AAEVVRADAVDVEVAPAQRVQEVGEGDDRDPHQQDTARLRQRGGRAEIHRRSSRRSSLVICSAVSSGPQSMPRRPSRSRTKTWVVWSMSAFAGGVWPACASGAAARALSAL